MPPLSIQHQKYGTASLNHNTKALDLVQFGGARPIAKGCVWHDARGLCEGYPLAGMTELGLGVLGEVGAVDLGVEALVARVVDAEEAAVG